MLQPSPKYESQLPTAVEQKALKLEHRYLRLRKNLFKALTALTALSIPFAAYANDVRANQSIQAESVIDIDIRGEALDPANNDKAIVFLDGFRSMNGDTIAYFRGEGMQQVLDGQLWSVGYNDANLDPTVIGKRIIALAESTGVKTIYFYMESAGGSIGSQVQEYVAQNSNITLSAQVYNSVPYGFKALREPRQNDINTIEFLASIPGAKYSSLVTYLGEAALGYTDTDRNKFAGPWLMFDQAMAIEDADIGERIANMGELPSTTQKPVIIYIGTTDGYDYMVNDDYSAEKFQKAAEGAGIKFVHLEVPGAVHSRPDIKPENFNETLADAKDDILSAIATEEAIAEFNQREKRMEEQSALK